MLVLSLREEEPGSLRVVNPSWSGRLTRFRRWLVDTPCDPRIHADTSADADPQKRRRFETLHDRIEDEQKDTGLEPLNPNYSIAGASSDITVVNVGDDADGLEVGDTIRFRPNYAAFVRLMSGRYVEKVLQPPAARQAEDREPGSFGVGPVLE